MVKTEARAFPRGLNPALHPQPPVPALYRDLFLKVLLVGFKKLFCPAFLEINTQLEHIAGSLGNLSLLPAAPRC